MAGELQLARRFYGAADPPYVDQSDERNSRTIDRHFRPGHHSWGGFVEGAQRRFWCAAHDPDPVIAQIGAVTLGLEGDFPAYLSWEMRCLL